MRIVTGGLAVVAACVTLAGCVSRVAPPPDPSASEQQGSGTSAECTTDDIEVTGARGEEPEVTLPDGCTRPTTLLTEDLVTGDGPTAVEGSDLTVDYVLVTWSDGAQQESTWGTEPFVTADLGATGQYLAGWNEGLLGIRQGGRRLVVIPPEDAYGSTGQGSIGPDETLVFVVDAVAVSG